MTYGSTGYAKAAYAGTLAATLAHFLDAQGDAVGLLTFDEAVRDYLPPRHRVGHLSRLMRALDRPASGRGTDVVAAMVRLVELLRKRGMVVVISDFLAPVERLESALVALTAGGHELVLFEVLDPAELTFPFREPALFEDAETGREVLVDPATVREDYRRRFEAHGRKVRDLCTNLGGSHIRLMSDQPLELALLNFLQARRQAGRRVRRAVGRMER